MSQTAFDYGQEARDTEHELALIGAVTEALAALGGRTRFLIRCKRLGMTDGVLSMCLSGERPFQARWLFALLELLGKGDLLDQQIALMLVFARPHGFEVKRRKRRTDKERADALRDALLKFGELGKRAAAEVDE